MKKVLLALAVLVLALGGSSACATKKFVKTQVDQVNDKVETLSKSLEETQERTRQNEQRIAQTDQRVTAVDQKADAAGKTAADARTAAADARTAAAAANTKAEEVDRVSKRLIYEVTISEGQGNFKFGEAALPAQAKTSLDELVEKLKASPNGGYIEIEGHTDNLGSKAFNEQLGLERAEAVKRYLHEAHQIPLHKMSVISYGAEKPIAPNTTRAGRAQNRRVVIKVLS